jgi:hypothetical protein
MFSVCLFAIYRRGSYNVTSPGMTGACRFYTYVSLKNSGRPAQGQPFVFRD